MASSCQLSAVSFQQNNKRFQAIGVRSLKLLAVAYSLLVWLNADR